MASEGKVIDQLGAQKFIYEIAKSSFEKHREKCENYYMGSDGEGMCSHPEGGRVCELDKCPKISPIEGGKK